MGKVGRTAYSSLLYTHVVGSCFFRVRNISAGDQRDTGSLVYIEVGKVREDKRWIFRGAWGCIR
jgi:hypothetical protein